MAAHLREVVVDVADPNSSGRFYADLLDRPLADRDGRVTVSLCESVDLVLTPGAAPKAGKNRLHFDLTSTSAAHQRELVDRALSLGASPLDIGQRDVPWVVLADPAGNEFCVLEQIGRAHV